MQEKQIINDISEYARKMHIEAKAPMDCMNAAVRGRKIRILSDYNGQPYGNSKPSQKGAICSVMHTVFDYHHGWQLQLAEFAYGHPFILMSDVEFVTQ